LHNAWDVLAFVVPGINLLILVWFAVHSRRWTAPIQAAQLAQLRAEVDMLRGAQQAMKTQMMADRSRELEATEQVWRELRTIVSRLDCPQHRLDCPLNKDRREEE
jgi:hypothetical protein